MQILNKYKYWTIPYIIATDKYWDMVLSKNDTDDVRIINGGYMTTDCLAAYIDMSDAACVSGNTIVSKPEFMWDKAVCSGATLYNIGFTGMDNGLITFDKDTITDDEFFNLLTETQLNISDNDLRLFLYNVSGNTKQFTYDLDIEDGYASLKGGFFQGFFKEYGQDYQILPTVVEKEWNLEFVLRPRDYVTAGNTLNKLYPENRGIFFFMGSRAENKFAEMYGEDLSVYPDRSDVFQPTCSDYFLDDYFTFSDGETTSGDTSGGTGDVSDRDIYDSNGEKIEGQRYTSIITDNKYLFFDRTVSGFTVDTWNDDTEIEIKYPKIHDKTNLYLVVNRTKDGLTADDLYKLENGEVSYDITTDTLVTNPSGTTNYGGYKILDDLFNNAFALKVNEDMSVGYRYFVQNCDNESGYEVIEENTVPNMVHQNEWCTINVKIKVLQSDTDNCGNAMPPQKIKIFVYVNGFLKLVSKELDGFNFKELADEPTRQEGVPFSISLGGGTQGLAESIWTKYKETFKKVLPIEQNFAGTFIGDIRSFKFYTCPLTYNQIKNNYLKNITE